MFRNFFFDLMGSYLEFSIWYFFWREGGKSKYFNFFSAKDEEEFAAKEKAVVKRAEVDDGGENGPFCKSTSLSSQWRFRYVARYVKIFKEFLSNYL